MADAALNALEYGRNIHRAREATRAMGCSLNNVYMQHSLLALVVIPELRISDVGIIDVTKFEKVDLFV